MTTEHTQTSGTERPSSRWFQLRLGVITLVLIALFALVLDKMYELQIEQGKYFDTRNGRRVLAGREIDSHRGYIYDRAGKELAVSIEVPSIFAHPHMVKDKETTAAALSSILGLREDKVLEKISGERPFVWLARKVSPAQGDAVRELKLEGIFIERESKRYYPGQELAGQILGFVGTDNEGLSGMEAAFNDILRGGTITVSGIRDARGQMLMTLETPALGELEGNSVVLTIDQHIQRVTEVAIQRAAIEHNAARAFGVVMDPKTGEILALATYPHFNPNRFRDYQQVDWRNQAVLDVFEPGSVFKPLLYAKVVDEGLVTPETEVDQEGGKIEIGDDTLEDTHEIPDMNAELVVVESSNVGAYKLAQLLGRETFYQGVRSYGFGERSGLGVAGESAGIVWPPKTWAEITFANMAFGQGFSVSPLQLAMATSVLANEGVLMEPLLVKEVRDKNGKLIQAWHPRVRRRVVSPEAARTALIAMEKVIGQGTGMRGWVEGYRAGGKTGTAQKADPVRKTYANKWMANFIGVVPIQDPDLVIVIMVDEPEPVHYGGIVSAPAFAEIASQVLPYRGVYPEGVYTGESVQIPTTTVQEGDLDDTSAQLSEIQLAMADPVEAGQVRVPDFTGLTLRNALERAQSAGVSLDIQGSGVVKEQWPAPATPVDVHTPIHVQLTRRYRQTHLGFVEEE